MTAATEPLEVTPRLRLKLVPLLVTAALALGVPLAGVLLTSWTSRLLHLHVQFGTNLPWLYMQHTGQLIVALLVIAILKYRLVPADYGLHWPRGRTYLWPAILAGVFFGVLMTGVNPLALEREGVSFVIGASIGIVMIHARIASPEEWLRAAASACYRAKQAGRGMLEFDRG